MIRPWGRCRTGPRGADGALRLCLCEGEPVLKDVPAHARMLGAPARPQKEAWRFMLSTERLPDLIKDVRHIKQVLGLGDGE